MMLSEERQEFSDFDWKRHGLITIGDARYEAFKEIQDAAAGLRLVFPTGFKKLDRQLLGGFTPGKLYILGGRPGAGKSFVSNEILFRVLNAAKKDKKKVICLYWSFEMPARQQIIRMITKEIQMTSAQLLSIDQVLPSDLINKAVKLTERYNNLPVFFKQVSTTIYDAFTTVSDIYKQYPYHTIINLWDHSRLFIPDDDSDGELQRLVALTQGLVRMQQKTQCINILLSQLNRNIEQPTRKASGYQPMLSDLFGSDSLGQEAEVVMLINRPHDLYNITHKYCGQDPIGLLALHIEKNRNGMMGMISFDCSIQTFTLQERNTNNIQI